MMTNLFSIFDPSSSLPLLTNWVSLLLITPLLPHMVWYMPGPPQKLHTKMNYLSATDLHPNIPKDPCTILFLQAIFYLIVIANLTGLLPFVFTPSSHLTFTLSLSIPVWLSMVMMAWAHNSQNYLAHLIPPQTPLILMPFMTIVEMLSNMIRPITLAVRLAANMIAGHLLVALISSSMAKSGLTAATTIFLAQTLLSCLELAVACIQAYVFTVLSTLYSSESSN